MKNVKDKINLLIIGNNLWCIDLANNLNKNQQYNIQYIYTYKDAIRRLRHNSYDILLLQQDYFNYNSIELSKLSYAMSRHSIILCKSLFKIIIYQIWKHTSDWTNKFTIAKQLIHFKKLKYKKLNQYIQQLITNNNLITEITAQIKKNTKIID